MFKALSNALYKTPWWAIASMGLFVFLLLVLFITPFHVLRLSDSGTNKEQKRAIQREIDKTFGDNALGLAERVVKVIRQTTEDAAHKAELDQALRDIAEARRKIFDAEREASLVAVDVSREAAKEKARAERDATRAAREVARNATIAARDAAKDKIQQINIARKETQDVQKRVGIIDDSSLGVFDKAIAEAERTQNVANQALDELNKQPNNTSVGLESNSKEAFNDSNATGAKKRVIESLPSSGPTKQNIDAPPVTKASDVIAIGNRSLPLISIDAKIPTPSAIPLPTEFKNDIRRKVTADVRRVGIGSALIVAFVPLFIMLLIAKYYIGRSRRAQELAQAKSIEADSANVNRQIVEAKLMALQAQVEPHFLYNTLANVQALTEVDPKQANQMTGHLIQYLRAALPKMRENVSTVGQEVELVRAYLNILKMRMGERLAFDIDVSEELAALPFPPLMLPSLVENAIKHGLEPQREGGRIEVIAEKIGEGLTAKLRMTVKDTGRGLTDAPTQSGGGVGLTNIRERLRALFGDQGRLTLESNQPKGVIAYIETPAAGASAHVSPNPTDEPKGWGARTLHVASRTHSLWARGLLKVFFGLMAVLAMLFVVGLLGIATGGIPLNVAGTTIGGIEGMALGTVVLLFAFGALASIALVVIAIIYGLGFLFVGLAVGIPILILLGVFPALAPLVFIGFLFYWFWWRKRKKVVVVTLPKT